MSFDPIGTHSIPREFHNVNYRFCGAIHDVDRANISVLSQVIHSVNERKTVQTNMISFVSHGDKTLQRLVGMPGEQEHHISSVPFFFFITYKITTCERTLIHAPSAPEKAPQNLRHYANETMDTYLISVKLEQVNTYISDTNNQI